MDNTIQTSFTDWQNGLQHYGVLGMKWGVHRDPSKAYQKANDKMNRLKNRRVKSEFEKTKTQMAFQKASKRQAKIEGKERVGPDDPGYQKYLKRSAEAHSKVQKAQNRYEQASFKSTKALYKEQKWAQNVLKAFGETTYEELEKKYRKKQT